MFKKLFIISMMALCAVSCCNSRHSGNGTAGQGFPKIDQGGKIAVVAHRGFWNCEAGGMSENSIASLKAAQDNRFWGSECDIYLTADDKIMVNHDNSINGKKIEEHNFADFDGDLLPNGEKRPSLDEYLIQAKKCKTTVLVLEFKGLKTPEREDLLVDKTFESLKAHKMFCPSRVIFISFSKHICDRVAEKAPEFVNQYLTGELSPEKLAADGINGFDYHMAVVDLNRRWVKEAHDLGMSTNVWTVDQEFTAKGLIELGVDAITTNDPLMVRGLLGEKECTL